jgi:hypothetical protein
MHGTLGMIYIIDGEANNFFCSNPFSRFGWRHIVLPKVHTVCTGASHQVNAVVNYQLCAHAVAHRQNSTHRRLNVGIGSILHAHLHPVAAAFKCMKCLLHSALNGWRICYEL